MTTIQNSNAHKNVDESERELRNNTTMTYLLQREKSAQASTFTRLHFRVDDAYIELFRHT